MTDTGAPADDQTPRIGTIDYFRQLQVLHDHWARPRRPPSYYWYLTFQDAKPLVDLTRKCQAAISFPYYDQIPVERLHMSLHRIAAIDELTEDQLAAIARTATRACEWIAPFDISVESLGGTMGAIGFNVRPAAALQQLRNTLAEAARQVRHVDQSRNYEVQPHVSIAYCNRAVPADQAIAAIETLNPLPPATTRIKEAILVLLERRERSYAWQTVAQLPLSG
jgi:2'-5' RNA ligase